MDVAEPERQIKLLFWRDILVAEEDNLMIQKRLVDLCECSVIQCVERSTPSISAPRPPEIGFT